MALTLAVLAVVFVALLSVPLEVLFRVQGAKTGPDRQDWLRSWVTVRWLFGLVSVPVTGRQDRGRPRRPRTRRKSKRAMFPRLLRLTGQMEFHRRVVRFLRQAFGAIRCRDCRIRLRVGCEDPADTGLLWALAGPASVFLAGNRNVALDAAPEFAGSRLEVEARGRVRLIPAQLAGITTLFALSPATLRAVWQLVRP